MAKSALKQLGHAALARRMYRDEDAELSPFKSTKFIGFPSFLLSLDTKRTPRLETCRCLGVAGPGRCQSCLPRLQSDVLPLNRPKICICRVFRGPRLKTCGPNCLQQKGHHEPLPVKNMPDSCSVFLVVTSAHQDCYRTGPWLDESFSVCMCSYIHVIYCVYSIT